MPRDPIPQVGVETLAQKLRTDDPFVLLDIREPWELELARIADARLKQAPMSALAQIGLKALPASARSSQAEIYVLCHHGVRSAEAAAWLASQGWTRVFAVSGGIDEYARKIDPSLGSY